MVKLLLENGANVDHQLKSGLNSLYLAAGEGITFDICRPLLEIEVT